MSCVLTLALDAASQQHFETLRQQWFPPERNLIPAHLTLFHMLPESAETEVVLGGIAERTRVFVLDVNTVRSLGRGVAFFAESHEAHALHGRLRDAFEAVLSAQDRQGFRPHVVVQNKVHPDVAKETLAVLQAGFAAWECQAVGLDLWQYLSGPWKHLRRFAFTA